MSIVRKVFMSIIRCIGFGFVGALGALILAVCLYFLATLFMPNTPNTLDVELMILVWGYCGIFVGFGLGVIYGAIRTLTSLERPAALIATSVIGVTVLLMPVLILAIQPIDIKYSTPQPVEAGKPQFVVRESGANPWAGKLHFSLAPGAPPGATIDPQSGKFSWTPPLDQPAGKYDVTVSVSAAGQRAGQTTFVITVPRPTPLVERKAPIEGGTDCKTKGPPKEFTVDLGGGVKLELVLIPAGEFLMGSPDSDKGAGNYEKPQHKVRITESYDQSVKPGFFMPLWRGVDSKIRRP